MKFDVKGWTTIEGSIKVTVTGLTPQTVSYTAVMSGSFETKTINFTGGTASSTVKIETTAKRAFIDNVLVFYAASTPSVVLADNGTQVAAGNVTAGSTAVVLHKFQCAVTTANAALTGISFTSAGSYVAGDLSNFKVWYSADSALNTGSDTLLGTISTGLGTGSHSLSSLSQTLNSGSTGYFFITADIASGAAANDTINVQAVATSDLTFSVGTKSGSTTAGGTQTVVAAANSAQSDISRASGFSEPANIDYASYQATDVTAGNSIELARFTIRDGGGSADSDSESTTLTAISFNVAKGSILRRVALYDGTTEIAEVAGGTTVGFSGLSGLVAADGSTKDFSVRATFNASVTDNEQLQFTVSSATADSGGSLFATVNAGGAASDTTGNANRVAVTATKLVFSAALPSSVGVGVGFSATVQAQDANGNVDLDATASVTISKATGTGTLSGGSAQSLVSGAKVFASLSYDTAEVFTIQAVDNAALLSSATSGNIMGTIVGSSSLVIAEIYGAGGNSGATYNADYVVLFNRGTASQSINGWSIQYASATGSSWAKQNLPAVSIPAGGCYLIQISDTGANGAALPTPDATVSPQIAMSATAGKVALVNSTTALSGTCPSGSSIVDFVGYGTTANCYEGTSYAPAPSTTTSDQRGSNGCTDTDVNSSDFTAASPTPRNSSTAINCCTPPATSAITGDSSVAIGQMGKTYSVTPTSGSSYAWTVPSGASITAGATGPDNNQVTVTFGSDSGNVTVTETTSGGCVGTPVSLAVTVTGNHAPVAPAAKALGTVKNTAATNAYVKLLVGATDADSHTLTVTAASTPTPHGTTELVAEGVKYTPASDYTGPDSFTYTISDGNGGTAVGTVNVTVEAGTGLSPNLVSYKHNGTGFTIIFAGVPGVEYTIESSPMPSPGYTWTKFGANITADSGDGTITVVDSPAPDDGRVYRTVWPSY